MLRRSKLSPILDAIDAVSGQAAPPLRGAAG